MKQQHRANNHKEYYRGGRKLDRIRLLHYLIYMLLPVLKKINCDHGLELNTESKKLQRRKTYSSGDELLIKQKIQGKNSGYPAVPLSPLKTGKLVKMADLHQETLEHFQNHWGRGHPVIVRNVLQRSTSLSWDPVIMFCSYIENKSSESWNEDGKKATNVLDWCELPVAVSHFDGIYFLFTSSSYKSELYAIAEYINPVSGILNVGVKLPKEFPKPDLGPCIYFSYGGSEELMQADYLSKLCYESHDKWKYRKSEDSDEYFLGRIQKALVPVTISKGLILVVHPILDQKFFLDAYHKLRLKEEFDIQPWTFEQCAGEAVFIPAGCPYQIRKIKSCVNVVLDFISPENATRCIQLKDEIRRLPMRHKAKGKVMEVEKMALHGISAAIQDICNLTPLEQIFCDSELPLDYLKKSNVIRLVTHEELMETCAIYGDELPKSCSIGWIRSPKHIILEINVLLDICRFCCSLLRSKQLFPVPRVRDDNNLLLPMVIWLARLPSGQGGKHAIMSGACPACAAYFCSRDTILVKKQGV
ncbi:UNVERIFIED_CONTAM: Lysine-specific demethylase [Sesamum radiatum]|uniref:Lysine-specific demethylase n=1 Tax=Sesamum radiatum TaxID=300843 RepID=A0AAW2K1C5_SESRA